MNKNLYEFTRQLIALVAIVCLTVALSISDVAAQKPGFAGKAAEKGGRSDEAKDHAEEQGKGKREGFKKDDEGFTDNKKAMKDKKGKKGKK